MLLSYFALSLTAISAQALGLKQTPGYTGDLSKPIVRTVNDMTPTDDNGNGSFFFLNKEPIRPAGSKAKTEPGLVCYAFNVSAEGRIINLETSPLSSSAHIEAEKVSLSTAIAHPDFATRSHGLPYAFCYVVKPWQPAAFRSASDMTREEKQWLVQSRNKVLDNNFDVNDAFYMTIKDVPPPNIASLAKVEQVKNHLTVQAQGNNIAALRALLLLVNEQREPELTKLAKQLATLNMTAEAKTLCPVLIEKVFWSDITVQDQPQFHQCLALMDSGHVASALMKRISATQLADNDFLHLAEILANKPIYTDYRLSMATAFQLTAAGQHEMAKQQLDRALALAKQFNINVEADIANILLLRENPSPEILAKAIRNLFVAITPTTADAS